VRPEICRLCQATSRFIEGPLNDGAWFCACCGRVFRDDPAGSIVIETEKLPPLRLSPFRQATLGKVNHVPRKP